MDLKMITLYLDFKYWERSLTAEGSSLMKSSTKREEAEARFLEKEAEERH